jgi:hypothetical protein
VSESNKKGFKASSRDWEKLGFGEDNLSLSVLDSTIGDSRQDCKPWQTIVAIA